MGIISLILLTLLTTLCAVAALEERAAIQEDEHLLLPGDRWMDEYSAEADEEQDHNEPSADTTGQGECPPLPLQDAKNILCMLRARDRNFRVENMDPCTCTHIVYSERQQQVVQSGAEASEKLQSMHGLMKRNPSLKILLETDLPELISPGQGQSFGYAAFGLVGSRSFHGLYVDLEDILLTAESGVALTHFFKAFRGQYTDSFGTEPLVVAALPRDLQEFMATNILNNIKEEVDFFVLREKYNGLPIVPESKVTTKADFQSEDATDILIYSGIHKSRIIIGISTFGELHKTALDEVNGGHSKTRMTFPQICSIISSSKWRTAHHHDESFIILPGMLQFIRYRSEHDMELKAQYVMLRRLGGMMLSALNDDDYKGTCKRGLFPLLTAVSSVFRLRKPLTAKENTLLQQQSSSLVKVFTTANSTRDKLPIDRNLCKHKGYYRDSTNCSRFYQCARPPPSLPTTAFVVFLYSCPDGMVFDQEFQICSWPSWSPPCNEVETEDPLPVPVSKFSCPSPGYHSDPNHCKWFYYCSNFGGKGLKAYEFHCPSEELAFDQELMLCNWKHLVTGCKGHGRQQSVEPVTTREEMHDRTVTTNVQDGAKRDEPLTPGRHARNIHLLVDRHEQSYPTETGSLKSNFNYEPNIGQNSETDRPTVNIIMPPASEVSNKIQNNPTKNDFDERNGKSYKTDTGYDTDGRTGYRRENDASGTVLPKDNGMVLPKDTRESVMHKPKSLREIFHYGIYTQSGVPHQDCNSEAMLTIVVPRNKTFSEKYLLQNTKTDQTLPESEKYSYTVNGNINGNKNPPVRPILLVLEEAKQQLKDEIPINRHMFNEPAYGITAARESSGSSDMLIEEIPQKGTNIDSSWNNGHSFSVSTEHQQQQQAMQRHMIQFVPKHKNMLKREANVSEVPDTITTTAEFSAQGSEHQQNYTNAQDLYNFPSTSNKNIHDSVSTGLQESYEDDSGRTDTYTKTTGQFTGYPALPLDGTSSEMASKMPGTPERQRTVYKVTHEENVHNMRAGKSYEIQEPNQSNIMHYEAAHRSMSASHESMDSETSSTTSLPEGITATSTTTRQAEIRRKFSTRDEQSANSETEAINHSSTENAEVTETLPSRHNTPSHTDISMNTTYESKQIITNSSDTLVSTAAPAAAASKSNAPNTQQFTAGSSGTEDMHTRSHTDTELDEIIFSELNGDDEDDSKPEELPKHSSGDNDLAARSSANLPSQELSDKALSTNSARNFRSRLPANTPVFSPSHSTVNTGRQFGSYTTTLNPHSSVIKINNGNVVPENNTDPLQLNAHVQPESLHSSAMTKNDNDHAAEPLSSVTHRASENPGHSHTYKYTSTDHTAIANDTEPRDDVPSSLWQFNRMAVNDSKSMEPTLKQNNRRNSTGHENNAADRSDKSVTFNGSYRLNEVTTVPLPHAVAEKVKHDALTTRRPDAVQSTTTAIPGQKDVGTKQQADDIFKNEIFASDKLTNSRQVDYDATHARNVEEQNSKEQKIIIDPSYKWYVLPRDSSVVTDMLRNENHTDSTFSGDIRSLASRKPKSRQFNELDHLLSPTSRFRWNVPFLNEKPKRKLAHGITCTREGLFFHPEDCTKFYECYWDQWLEKYTVHLFSCPVKLVFDERMYGCINPGKHEACIKSR